MQEELQQLLGKLTKAVYSEPDGTVRALRGVMSSVESGRITLKTLTKLVFIDTSKLIEIKAVEENSGNGGRY